MSTPRNVETASRDTDAARGARATLRAAAVTWSGGLLGKALAVGRDTYLARGFGLTSALDVGLLVQTAMSIVAKAAGTAAARSRAIDAGRSWARDLGIFSLVAVGAVVALYSSGHAATSALSALALLGFSQTASFYLVTLLQVRGNFSAPALSNIVENSVFVGALVLQDGRTSTSFLWAAALSNTATSLWLFGFSRRASASLRPIPTGARDPFAVLVTASLLQEATPLASRLLASFLGPGALSALTLASRISDATLGFLGYGVSSAAFARLVGQAKRLQLAVVDRLVTGTAMASVLAATALWIAAPLLTVFVVGSGSEASQDAFRSSVRAMCLAGVTAPGLALLTNLMILRRKFSLLLTVQAVGPLSLLAFGLLQPRHWPTLQLLLCLANLATLSALSLDTRFFRLGRSLLGLGIASTLASLVLWRFA